MTLWLRKTLKIILICTNVCIALSYAYVFAMMAIGILLGAYSISFTVLPLLLFAGLCWLEIIVLKIIWKMTAVDFKGRQTMVILAVTILGFLFMSWLIWYVMLAPKYIY